MSKTLPQYRFGVKFRGSSYDIFSLIVDNDESIYFKTYSKTKKVAQKRMLSESLPLKVNIRAQDYSGFEPNKTSFHKSGYIASTDNNCKRNSSFDGSVGIKFKNIIDTVLLFSFYPMKPSVYRKSSKPRVELDIESFKITYFQISCYLAKNNFDFSKDANRLDKQYKGVFIEMDNFLSKHDLKLIVRYHQSSDMVFPNTEIIVYFTDFMDQQTIGTKK